MYLCISWASAFPCKPISIWFFFSSRMSFSPLRSSAQTELPGLSGAEWKWPQNWLLIQLSSPAACQSPQDGSGNCRNAETRNNRGIKTVRRGSRTVMCHATVARVALSKGIGTNARGKSQHKMASRHSERGCASEVKEEFAECSDYSESPRSLFDESV